MADPAEAVRVGLAAATILAARTPTTAVHGGLSPVPDSIRAGRRRADTTLADATDAILGAGATLRVGTGCAWPTAVDSRLRFAGSPISAGCRKATTLLAEPGATILMVATRPLVLAAGAIGPPAVHVGFQARAHAVDALLRLATAQIAATLRTVPGVAASGAGIAGSAVTTTVDIGLVAVAAPVVAVGPGFGGLVAALHVHIASIRRLGARRRPRIATTHHEEQREYESHRRIPHPIHPRVRRDSIRHAQPDS